MRFFRFRLRSLFLFSAAVAVLLGFYMVVIQPHKAAHDAFIRLSPRLFYAGTYYYGPDCDVKAIRTSYLFSRFHTLHMRIESTDTDRREILDDLRTLPYLENVELFSGDPYPETQQNLRDALREIKTAFPSVNVKILQAATLVKNKVKPAL